MTHDAHQRLLLAKNTAGTVEFCEGCEVVELNVGATSLRFYMEDLAVLATLLRDADARLQYYQLAQAGIEQMRPTSAKELN